MSVPPVFIELVQAFSSGVTEKIKQAEELYVQLKAQQPNELVNSFIILMRTSQDELLRSYPPILLRTLINSNDAGNVLKGLTIETINNLKAELMLAVRLEPKNNIRHSILNVIAVLAIELIPKQQWPEILGFILELSSSTEEVQRESSFFLIRGIIEDSNVASFLSGSFNQFYQLTERGLTDSSIKVQIAAMEVVSSFVDADPNSDVFKKSIPYMLKTIEKAVEMNFEQEAQKGFITFIMIAQYNSNWLKAHFDMIFKVFFGFLENQTLEDETRHTCLHFFLTFAEFKSSIVKKRQYLEPLVLILLKWMSSVEDMEDSQWNALDVEPNDDDDCNVALEAIESLSHNVGKGLWTFFREIAGKLINSSNWKERYTCLMTLSYITEGCYKQIKTDFKQILGFILPLSNDQHPRVRFALFYCLGSFATSLKREMHEQFQQLIPTSLNHLSDPFSRVIISNCEFLTLFLDEIKPARVTEYKGQFLDKLSPLLQNNDYKIVQHSLNAFSSVVDAIGSDFTQYYEGIMPFLVKILQTQTSNETKTLRGRAIETISLIGLAVGKKVFGKDCVEIIQYCSKLEKFKDDDPQVDFFLRAFTRFAQCLGEDFVPFLPYAMNPLMDAINGQFEQSNDPDNYGDLNQAGEIVVENKAMALEMVSIYAMELKHYLFPYIENLYKGSIALIDFPYNSSVAIHAVGLLPYLVKIAKQHFEVTNGLENGMFEEFSRKLFTDVLKNMTNSIKTEFDPDTLSAKLKSLTELIDIGSGYNYPGMFDIIFEAVIESFSSLSDMEKEYQEVIDQEDEDAEDAPEREIIDDAYNSLAMVLGEICIQYKDVAVSYITGVLPTIIDLIEKAESVEIKTSMICIIDDLIESGGVEAHKLYAHIIKPLVACVAPNNEASLIQSAAYGIGLAAENGRDAFAPFLMESLTALNNVINTPTNNDEDLIVARDNAISAMGRIMINLPTHLGNNFPQLVSTWINYLPIQDDGEAGSIIKTISILLKDYMQIAISQQTINKILEAIAVGLQKKAIGPQEKQIILAVLLRPEIFDLVGKSASSLDPKYTQLLQAFFQNK